LVAYHLVIAAWKLRSELTPIESRVFMELADRINGEQPVERGTWPSWSTIAKAAGVSRKSAKRAAAALAEKGLLEITPRDDRESNLFTFGARVLETLPGVAETLGGVLVTPGVGSHRPPPRVTVTPEPKEDEPKEDNQRNEPSPPTPQGGRRVRKRTKTGSQSSEEARIRAWWSERVCPIDPRITDHEVFDEDRQRKFRARLERFPDLLERLPGALTPMAGWVTSKLEFETFFRSDKAMDAALKGKFQERNGHGGRRREELENERREILMKRGSTSDLDEARLRAIRFELERMR
jgi:hypothetical protein